VWPASRVPALYPVEFTIAARRLAQAALEELKAWRRRHARRGRKRARFSATGIASRDARLAIEKHADLIEAHLNAQVRTGDPLGPAQICGKILYNFCRGGRQSMGRKLVGAKPKPATIWQRRWRKKAAHQRKHSAAVERRAEIFNRLAESTAREAARLGAMQLYQLLLCDPPWREDAWSEAGMGRSADNHYQTTSMPALKALTPPAAKVSTMFMWTTSTYLHWAIDLLAHWAFEYGGTIAWDKKIIGKGRRFRLQVELLIYGSKGGGLAAPPPKDRTPNLIRIRAIRKRGVHSPKPPEVRKMLAKQYPNVARVEMFSRAPADAEWDVWGNEAPSLNLAAE
jgi:N6-adenosine-specific RNA methylase IME4